MQTRLKLWFECCNFADSLFAFPWRAQDDSVASQLRRLLSRRTPMSLIPVFLKESARQVVRQFMRLFFWI